MFTITINDIDSIRKDYGIRSHVTSFTELQRYHYERDDPESKEVRLIVKADLCGDEPIVIRFKNETHVTLELIEDQSRFAALLGKNGIATPTQYQAENHYAKWYSLNGYDVIVTVEQFASGELHCVDTAIAMDTGKLLAQMHNIAEFADFHVESEVLFDPFTSNDLFAFSEFKAREDELLAIDAALYEEIVKKYEAYMQKLSPLQREPRYAVQGDISDCNLYQAGHSRIGVFDFNRCGDNNLYCDAVMQAVFDARLMDYPDSYSGCHEALVLPAFLQGYQQERPFSAIQKELYPYLYAIINTFWSMDIKWSEHSLIKELEKGNAENVHAWLTEMHRRIRFLPPMPL